MIFGISELMPGGEFNVRKHLDLTKCTVTIDTWFTKKTMFRYSTVDWDRTKQLIQQIALYHCSWRIDLSMGNTIWANGQWDTSILPDPPKVSFDMPFISIKRWLNDSIGQIVPLQLECCHCKESFNSPGHLLHPLLFNAWD